MATTPADLLDLSGRVILVTGASRGIGAGIAAGVASAGATVVIGGTNEEAARAVAIGINEQHPGRAFVAIFPVTDSDAVTAAIADIVERHGRLDGVVNCAGVQPVAPLLEQSAADWDEMMGVNARGVFLCTQAAARAMIAAGRGGSIVNVSSIEGLQPAALHSHYNASKAAVIMHSRAAALELGPYGIRVNAVAPGLIATPTIETDWPDGVYRWMDRVPLGRLGQPSDVANACVFLLSDLSSFVSGAVLTIDGGMLAQSTW